MLMRTLKGVGFGLAGTVIFILILSFIVVYTPFPYDMSGSGVMASILAGMFIGGIVSSVGMPGKGWIRGLICGAAMLLVFIVIGLIISGGAIIQAGLFKGVFASVLCAAAGGILGINIRVKR